MTLDHCLLCAKRFPGYGLDCPACAARLAVNAERERLAGVHRREQHALDTVRAAGLAMFVSRCMWCGELYGLRYAKPCDGAAADVSDGACEPCLETQARLDEADTARDDDAWIWGEA